MVSKFAALVNRQIGFWQSEIDRFPPGHSRRRDFKIDTYERLVAEFGELLAYLKQLDDDDPKPVDRRPRAVETIVHGQAPQAAAPRVDPELADLPPELLAELSDSVKGESEPLIKIIQERGGTASLDQILIDLWRKYKEVGKRTLVANKLYRLSRRNLCWSVPGRKGIYTTIRPIGAVGSNDESGGENDEGSGGGTSEPSNETGVAGSPGSPTKATSVGSSPTTSTLKRKLLAETAPLPFTNLPNRRPAVRP